MKNEFIEKCFMALENNQKSIFDLNFDELTREYHINAGILKDQKVNLQSNTWSLMDSSLNDVEIRKLESKYNITLPCLYRDFISSYAHLIYKLEGKLDNFLFEDNVDVIWKPAIQPFNHELEFIDKQIGDIIELLNADYLYIGDFNYSGPLCIDLKAENENNMQIVWMDYELWCSCENDTREEYEEIASVIFDNFHQLMECFFLKQVHQCED